MQDPDTKPSSESAEIAPDVKSVPFPKAGDSAVIGAAGVRQPRAVDDVPGALDGAAQSGDDFVKQLVELAHSAIDKIADAAGPTVDRIAGAFSNPSAKASSLLDRADDKKALWVSEVRDIVREHPITTIAVALTAGMVYARLTAVPGRDPRDSVDE